MRNKIKLRGMGLFLGLLSCVSSAQGTLPYTLLDINAQNDVALAGMKVRLQLDEVSNGPSDRFYKNVGGPFIPKDKNGNFLEFRDSRGHDYHYVTSGQPVLYSSRSLTNLALEAQRVMKQTVINAWGTISYTKRLINEDLHRIFPVSSSALERWNSQQPVKLYTLDQTTQNNAFFSPDNRGGSIHFCPLVNKRKQEIGSTANDFETVSHETGHNISYLLRPNRDLSRPQTGAMDESFGDFIAFSTALNIDSIRREFLKETKGNLRRSSFLTETAESLSQAIGLGSHGIRNAFNDFTLDGVACEVHDLSRVFTGALYDIFVEAFEKECPQTWFSCTADERNWKYQIKRINADLRSLVLTAHCLVPYRNPTFGDMGKTMYKIAENSTTYDYLAPIVSVAFENRGIDINIPHNDLSVCDHKAEKKHGIGGSVDTEICGTLENLKKRVSIPLITLLNIE